MLPGRLRVRPEASLNHWCRPCLCWRPRGQRFPLQRQARPGRREMHSIFYDEVLHVCPEYPPTQCLLHQTQEKTDELLLLSNSSGNVYSLLGGSKTTTLGMDSKRHWIPSVPKDITSRCYLQEL